MKHAILIDSDECARAEISAFLRRAGYAVTEIPAIGQLAFVKLHPDVMFIDVQCQLHLNFISRILKTSCYYINIQIVLMSESPLLKKYSIDIPVKAVLYKPFHQKQIQSMLALV